MADYIDRELVIKSIDEIWEDCRYQTIRKDVDENYHKHHKGRFSGVNRIRNVVLDAPAADVVKVVHCKDCTRYLERSGRCWRMCFPMGADDYCSKGERKAE